MRSNTRLNRLFKKFQRKIFQRGEIFKKTFVTSTFCLFFGFMCGNLFGTFLNFFRSFIHWDGAIIAVTLLFIELINYFNFVVLKKQTMQQSLARLAIKTEPKKVGVIEALLFILPFPNKGKEKKAMKTNKYLMVNLSFRIKSKIALFIRFLNFYKIGLLLGFFIDAFKVGS